MAGLLVLFNRSIAGEEPFCGTRLSRSVSGRAGGTHARGQWCDASDDGSPVGDDQRNQCECAAAEYCADAAGWVQLRCLPYLWMLMDYEQRHLVHRQSTGDDGQDRPRDEFQCVGTRSHVSGFGNRDKLAGELRLRACLALRPILSIDIIELSVPRYWP